MTAIRNFWHNSCESCIGSEVQQLAADNTSVEVSKKLGEHTIMSASAHESLRVGEREGMSA